LALSLVVGGLAGCPTIDGGAVEVAWVTRTADNNSTPCDSDWLPAQYKIDRIRLRISPEEDPGMDLCASVDAPSICEFSCTDGGGSTAFDIPEGTYSFDLVPLTEDGSIIPASVVALPAPLWRTIVEGDITDLGIWQIVVLNDVRL
jgi:hypothetical protein